MTVAEEVAAYLGEHCPVVFGIIGAGNMSLFDAIARLGRTTVVCCHHEQAAVMAAIAYGRVVGKPTCAIVTTGAGSSNALTGVLSAWMDSLAVVVIAGNEASTRPHIGRAQGVQGYPSAQFARPITKQSHRVDSADHGMAACLYDSFLTAECGRPGPVWIEIPMDIACLAVA